jgi:hypothetical protein
MRSVAEPRYLQVLAHILLMISHRKPNALFLGITSSSSTYVFYADPFSSQMCRAASLSAFKSSSYTHIFDTDPTAPYKFAFSF